MSEILQVKDLHTYIGQFHILQGVNLTVEQGGVTCLLGRNGAGKSTTLKTIIGLLAPKSGTIGLAGGGAGAGPALTNIGGRPAHQVARLGIGYVPEDRGVFVDLTVEENLRLAERKRGDLAAKKDWLVKLFPDLERFWQQKGGRLSGGQQQMLAIGRALVPENKLLLIDEPSKGLAPIVVEQLAGALKELKRQTTIVLVEQNLWLAAAVGDRATVLDDGRTVWAGVMADLMASPELQNRYLGVGRAG
ncbi:MAG TPA: ABC transporter ATP-binding protein [Symbiobacteriaceae bacterium]|nr:ABC transporter ATP-binding protein [Symbiobacteriaceae bacterium]